MSGMRSIEHHCGCVPRREFLSDLGLGFTGLALGTMLGSESLAKPSGQPLVAPRAKSVIWVFLSGGYSHIETFDPKPALNRHAGKTFEETPYPNPFKSPLHDKRSRSVIRQVREKYSKIMPMQVGYRARGESGIEVTDWWPELGGCVDDIAFVRNMYTTDNDHAAENQIHTGRHKLDETQPSVGAWAMWGLGTLNENLPEFVVLGGPTRADTRESFHSYYLGPQFAGVPLGLGDGASMPYGRRPGSLLEEEQRREFELIGRLNRLTTSGSPVDSALRARIRSYELAYRMQRAVPETLKLSGETREQQQLYGLDNSTTRTAGRRLLAARRLVERGVRFVQVYPTAYGKWDSHQALKKNHSSMCAKIDKPIAGLITDLKRRGLFEDVLVVFCTEFGRTPAIEERAGGKDGRDHHPHGFTVWFAGAGVKRGVVHGATDELGFHAIEPGHYVTDMHATVLHLLGLDPRQLDIPGRKRLDIDRGEPIRDILA